VCEIGDRNEDSDDAVAAGYAIEQAPEARAMVEKGAAVDVPVSTGPEQVPAAVQAAAPQAAPISIDAEPRQEASTARVVLTTSQSGSTFPAFNKSEKKGGK
jgi:beta-lactam-binding protein with PASTA domain